MHMEISVAIVNFKFAESLLFSFPLTNFSACFIVRKRYKWPVKSTYILSEEFI